MHFLCTQALGCSDRSGDNFAEPGRGCDRSFVKSAPNILPINENVTLLSLILCQTQGFPSTRHDMPFHKLPLV